LFASKDYGFKQLVELFTCIQLSDIRIDIYKFSGDFVGRVTPVPIPNTEVKPTGADDTAGLPLWESRKSPDLILKKKPVSIEAGFFVLKVSHVPLRMCFHPENTYVSPQPVN
jgi:hypothetical protein